MLTAPFGPLPRFILVYACMYAAFGVASPFWPRFFESRGLAPEQIGVLVAAGTAVRLISGPVAGRIADLTQALRAVLARCTALAALVALGLLPAQGFWALLLISLAHAAALAPTTTLADALALGAARREPGHKGFEYGWVRGTGSAAFVGGTLLAGQVVAAAELVSIIGLQAALLAAAALAALVLPDLVRRPEETLTPKLARGGVLELLRMPAFRRLVLVAALVL